VAPLEQVAVPAQHRIRAHQQQEVPQSVHREVVEQAGEEGAVGVGEGGLADLALPDQQLVPERQDLDVLVVVAHRQEAQERQGGGRSEVGEAQDTRDHDGAGARTVTARASIAQAWRSNQGRDLAG
jgi:hypothetical protein